ncbi:hypothetical protein ACFYM2_14920 [Streptomyces sp. NPDC006711]
MVAAGRPLKVTTALSDLGKPIAVTVPSADETVPASDFTGILSG